MGLGVASQVVPLGASWVRARSQLPPYTTQLVFPGVAGNYLSVPAAANLDITGDIEIVARVSAVDWTPATRNTIVDNDTIGSAPRGWIVRVGPTGTIEAIWPNAAGTAQVSTASSTVGFADGVLGWVKVTRAAATGLVSFYSAADSPTEPTTWTARGTGSTTADALPVVNRGVWIAARTTGGTTEPFAGRIARTIVRNGIAGTTVLDVAEENAYPAAGQGDQATFPATTGQTVTVNQTAGNTIVQTVP
jgi:hypothetical protein